MRLRIALVALALAFLGGCIGPLERTSPCACDWERIAPAAGTAGEPMGDLA